MQKAREEADQPGKQQAAVFPGIQVESIEIQCNKMQFTKFLISGILQQVSNQNNGAVTFLGRQVTRSM
jgi:hypothetical protein